jgi:hypothetical protein
MSYPRPAITSNTKIELEGYDCDTENNPTQFISLLSDENCEKAFKNVTTTTTIIQITKPQHFKLISFYMCSIKMLITLQNCGRWYIGRNWGKGSYTKERHLSRDACIDLHRKLVYKDAIYSNLAVELKETSNNQFFGETKETIVGSAENGCEGGIFSDGEGSILDNTVVHAQIKIKITTGNINQNLDDNSVQIGSTTCNFSDGYCSTESGDYYWKTDSNKICKTNQLVIFEGPCTKSVENINNSTKVTYSLIDNSTQTQFILQKTGEKRICNHISILTQTDNINIIESSDGYFELKLNEKEIVNNVDLALYHSMKSFLIHRDIIDQVQEAFNSMQFQNCMNQRHTLASLMAITRLNPSFGAMGMLIKPGINAIILGDAIKLTDCTKTQVQLRFTPDCYKDLPIFANGKPKFLTGVSKIITNKSETISCTTRADLKPYFNINNTWIQQEQKFVYRTANPPINLSIHKQINLTFKEIQKLVDSGIYEHNTLQKHINQLKFTPSTETGKKIINNEILLQEGQLFLSNIQQNESWDLFWHLFEDLIEKAQKFGNFASIFIGIGIICHIIGLIINILTGRKLINDIQNIINHCCITKTRNNVESQV